MAKVLLTRLSAFGDVAMLVPVVWSVARAYPQDEFVVLTRSAFAPLFQSLGENISVKTFDAGGKHQGFRGLLRLAKEIRGEKFTHFADVHNVLRSKVLRFLLRCNGLKTKHIHKGRAEKKRMLRTKQTAPPLTHTVERYRAVLQALGFPFEISFRGIFADKHPHFSQLGSFAPQTGERRIGIAPFAKHQGKIYPLPQMEEVIKILNDKGFTIFLFGGKGDEEKVLHTWADKYPNAHSVVGKLSLKEELMLIYSLSVLLSMDSANMHLATLVGTPVVSVWGATHPSLGFSPYGQGCENIIQTPLDCRPCSVFGNAPCVRKGDEYACLRQISPQTIVDKMARFF